MSENNKIKLKLEKIVNTDKDGKDIRDRDGNLTYIRYDVIALMQLLNAVNNKAIAVNEYKTLITTDNKTREELKNDRGEIELTFDEAALLKKLLSNPQNEGINFSLFHIRTISAILEQLK